MQAQDAGVNLWVAIPPINWLSLFLKGFDSMEAWCHHSDAQILAAVQAAEQAGFPLQGAATIPGAAHGPRLLGGVGGGARDPAALSCHCVGTLQSFLRCVFVSSCV